MSVGKRDFMGATAGATLIGGSMFAGVISAQVVQTPVTYETVTTFDLADWASGCRREAARTPADPE